jgi:hypothetical protein
VLALAPTLVDLARNPERVSDVPVSVVPSLMAQTAALQVALAARLVETSSRSDPPAGAPQLESEGLLSPPEAAARLGVTVT